MKSIIRAAAILRSGGLVAFPTETVYGLGADATNAAAVDRIFEAKGRPSTNPLICHVTDEQMARRYARDWPLAASRITDRFWPGPLTVVVSKTSDIPDNVTAGLPTVGLRAPNHELALQLLRVFDKPLAGPSANRSNHVSPTTADHVRHDLGNRVDMILDGGPCTVGIESTVLDVTALPPAILRLGGISQAQIEAVIGPVNFKTTLTSPASPAASPGQQPVHYAPRAPAYRFDASDAGRVPFNGPRIDLSPDPQDYARRFYATLRALDAQHPPAIYIEVPPDTPAWAAVRDRILRATQPLP
jgi:L-threonylcarbamoyladenylate synthase